MKGTKAAKRYVKAIFELAKAQKQLDALAGDMQTAAQIFHAHPELVRFLDNPMVAQSKKYGALNKIFAETSPLFRQLLDLLAQRKRLELLPEIARLFNEHYKKFRGIAEALLIVATEIDDQTRQMFLDKIKQIGGKEQIELSVKVDPSIIGGYIIQMGDLRVDDSVKGKLNKIKQKLQV